VQLRTLYIKSALVAHLQISKMFRIEDSAPKSCEFRASKSKFSRSTSIN
jgi:hypothetical protein